MNTYADKTKENKSQASSNGAAKMQSDSESTFQFVESRPEAIQMQQLQELANNSAQVSGIAQLQAMADNFTTQKQPIQRKENKTGLPDNLKTGMENLSGYSMDDVKVHRNSDKPAQLNAHAYAQGTDIHLGPGQEKHLPHELGHVVQQKQGRVKPTMQMKGKVNINDDAGLEKEADVMGAKALKI
jgi:predicted RecB family nuclease